MIASAAPTDSMPAAVATMPPLCELARRVLPQMYRSEDRAFVFSRRRVNGSLASRGLSHRYTAIALIGLAAEGDFGPFDADERRAIGDSLIAGLDQAGLGDAALIAWAAYATGHQDRARAWTRINELRPADRAYPTVEVAWTLAALSLDREARIDDLDDRLTQCLLSAYDRRSCLFPHRIDQGGFRSHVSCFADQVYPIHALALRARAAEDRRALDVASECGAQICRLQGSAGQWWWHYDQRVGRVIEEYPVYAIHQDAMAPMALFALEDAGGPSFRRNIDRGIDWLRASPELDGRSLIDDEHQMVWRKVARQEPGKASRYLQAAASRFGSTVPAAIRDRLFPPRTIDFEDRPYHWGWLLYAWFGGGGSPMWISRFPS